jgi:cell division protein FtsN
VAVLAGSYTSRSNAERHAKELQDKGFASRVVDATINGKRYYRVLVGEAGSYDEAMALLEKLKDSSFESVPLLLGDSP